MITVFIVIQLIAGFIILIEALNKLERVDITAAGLTPYARGMEVLKALAWGLLGLSAAVSLFALFMPMPVWVTNYPNLENACFSGGMACLIIRTRIRETQDGLVVMMYSENSGPGSLTPRP